MTETIYPPLSEIEWISPKHLEYLTQIKPDVQKQLRFNKKIPYYKLGGYVRYKKTEILAWLDSAVKMV